MAIINGVIKRLPLVSLALLVLVAVTWLARKPLIMAVIAYKDQPTVAANRPVDWSQGGAYDQRLDGLTESGAGIPGGQPNIVFILADDLGINDLSTFGGGVAGGRVPTPSIDRLAAEGVSFEQAYSGTATCAPSRAMLMTGRYPTRTGYEFTPTPNGMGRIIELFSPNESIGLPPVRRNPLAAAEQPRFEEQGLPGDELTVAELLRDAGYNTAHIGKWHLGRSPESVATAQGFDNSLLMASGLYLPVDDPSVVNARLSYDPIGEFLWARMRYAASFNNSEWFAPRGYLTDYWTDEAIRFIDAQQEQPFFLYFAHWGVHTPLQASREDYEAVGDIEPHHLRVYAAMIRALDRSVGRLLDALEERGMADNTLIVFSSDNGGAGYLGLPEVNAPYRGWKLTLFEGGIRVPLFMRWPNRLPASRQVAAPVAHIDVMPTLLEAAGVPPPSDRTIDGVSLLAAAEGMGAVERPNNAIFWSSGNYRAVRAGSWKLQVEYGRGVKRLYNLEADPTEETNLEARYPERVHALSALMDAHWATGRDPLFEHTLLGPVAVDKTAAEAVLPTDDYVVWPN